MRTSAFVEQLYLTLFGRPSDAAGLAHWSQLIDAGTVSAAELTRQFLDSAEFADTVAPLVRLYYSAFERIPDAAGLRFWLQKAQAGMSLDAIADAFVKTPEFAELYGAARDPAFIDLIYENALGHAPEAAAKAHWLDLLAHGQASRADVLGALAGSAGMASASSAAIKVIAQYHGITGSAPTQQQIDAAMALDQPLTLINQLFAGSRYTGAAVPHPFVTDTIATGRGGGAAVSGQINTAPVINVGASTPANGATEGVSLTPTIVLAFSQDVFAASGMIYITDGAAQTVIDRATGQPKVRIVGASDTRAIDVNDAAHVSFDGARVSITVSSPLTSGVTYSVLIGKGVLAGAGNLPFAGISDTTLLNFRPFGDATAPTVVVIGIDRESFMAGHTATVTVELSEAIQTLDASAFDAPNGTLSNFASLDGGRTWTALFTAALGVEDSSNAITLRAGGIRDLAGNPNSAAAVSANYAVDTVVTAVVDTRLEFNDSGISASDKLTNDPTQTLSGKFIGATSGMTLKVIINGVAHEVTPNDDNTWSFGDGVFAEGLNTVIAQFTNLEGKASAARALSFTLDTTAPQVTGGLQAPVDPAAALALSFSEAVYRTDPAAQLVFESAGGNVTVNAGDLALSANGTTLTVGANLLAAGTTYTLKLPASLTDAAGNPVAAPLSFTTSGAPADTVAEALAALDLLAIHDTGASASDNVTQGLATVFSGVAEPLATIRLYDLATDLLLATQAADADGKWSIDLDALPEGPLRLAATQTDASGNVSPMSPELALTVDRTAANAPTALALLAASDSGFSSIDNITRVSKPVLVGAAAGAGDVVKLYADGVEVGTSTVGGDGNWQVGAGTALADGVRSLSVRFMDLAGNLSAASDALSVTIDTLSPTLVSTNPLNGQSTADYVHLLFSEQIKFTSGALRIETEGGFLAHLFQVIHGASWEIGGNASGNNLSTLSVLPNVSPGQYKLEIDPNSIFDLAGNAYVPLVGVPAVVFWA